VSERRKRSFRSAKGGSTIRSRFDGSTVRSRKLNQMSPQEISDDSRDGGPDDMKAPLTGKEVKYF